LFFSEQERAPSAFCGINFISVFLEIPIVILCLGRRESTGNSLVAVSVIILIIGVGVFAYSYTPETIKMPRQVWSDRPVEKVIVDQEFSALSNYYTKMGTYNAGDQISVTATISEGTLSADVWSLYTGKRVGEQIDVKEVNFIVTVPTSGSYEISVSRYKPSAFTIYFEKTTASIQVKVQTTERVSSTVYDYLTVYPHKDFATVGIAVLLLGIGVGVVAIAYRNQPKQSSTPT
jgi:hypothetical protein